MTETLASAVPPLIVFSDLDGTLLDEQYDFSPAKPALRLLEDRGIPLVLATSKTRAELATLRAALGGAPSLIFENGAGLALPRNGEPAVQILAPATPESLSASPPWARSRRPLKALPPSGRSALPRSRA